MLVILIQLCTVSYMQKLVAPHASELKDTGSQDNRVKISGAEDAPLQPHADHLWWIGVHCFFPHFTTIC